MPQTVFRLVVCLSASSHLNTTPVWQPCLSVDAGTAKPSSNHLENQLYLVTKKITLVWNTSFPHALPHCLSSWFSWPVVKCVAEANPTLEYWPFLYWPSNFIPRVRAVFLYEVCSPISSLPFQKTLLQSSYLHVLAFVVSRDSWTEDHRMSRLYSFHVIAFKGSWYNQV